FMDAKKRMMATLAGFIVYFVLGFLLYGILLSDFMRANTGSATGVMRTDDEIICCKYNLFNITILGIN
ncbi:MAG: hypothetical protein ACKPA8_22125, partial [Dolichospermum sp.]